MHKHPSDLPCRRKGRQPVVRSQSSVAIRIAVAYRPIDQLVPSPKNPRQHSARQIRQIAKSIRTFGFISPIVIDAERNVIIGHGRWQAAKQIGLTEVPTIQVEHLSRAQLVALTIADNRLTETSSWDERLLAEQLKELSELDLDFDIESTGFEMGEIDLRIEGLESGGDPQDDPADTIPLMPERPPVSRTGDLWLLGRHRLGCGNALDRRAYGALMDGERADLVFTDPHYNGPIDGHACGLGAIRHRDFAMAVGEMGEEEFTAFLTEACSLLASNSVEGAIHFLCMDWRHLRELLAAGGEVYFELKNICVWVKHNAGMGSFYRSQHELVCVFKHGRGVHRNNVQLGQYGRHRTNVWSYPGVNSFGRATEEGNLLALHPTVKPVAMVTDAILDCSARGDIVLDPFMGSGTTVMAAERVGRRCYGMEIDPLYVDTAIRRWQAFTGATARQSETGRAFDEVALEKETRNGQ
jgi:DNA modification methylase